MTPGGSAMEQREVSHECLNKYHPRKWLIHTTIFKESFSSIRLLLRDGMMNDFNQHISGGAHKLPISLWLCWLV